jgi:hypothetical protein
VPLARATRIDKTPAQLAAMRQSSLAMGLDGDEVVRLATEPMEMWKNHRYTVIVGRDDNGHVEHISLRRNDRKPTMPWRDLQRIKTELAGADAEAIELFPAEDRVVDCANQRHLWVWPPGEQIGIGFEHGMRGTPEEAAAFGAVQS